MGPAEAHEQLQKPKKRKEGTIFTGLTIPDQSQETELFFFFEVYLNNLCYIYPTDKPWNDNII